MSSETEFKCDFCSGIIVHATKLGARGYCGIVRDNEVARWCINPFEKINGPHICEQCVNSLIKSSAFKAVTLCVHN